MKEINKKLNYHEGHRERLRRKHDTDRELNGFEDHEILEYLLSLVIPRKDTNELAHEMIAELGSLHNVFMSTQRDLKEFKNMTNSASYLLSAIYPAVRRSLRTVDTYGKKISMDSIQAMVDHLQPKFIGRKTECIAVLYLNHRYKILHEEWEEGEYPERIGVDAMAILKRAVKEGASYIAFAHNHPSQDLTPSREDIVETTKMFADLESLGLSLADSFIFSDTSFTSFRRMGVLDYCHKTYNEAMKNDPTNMLSPKYYQNSNFDFNLIESLLDYDKLRKEGRFQAKENPDSLSEKAKLDPRYKK